MYCVIRLKLNSPFYEVADEVYGPYETIDNAKSVCDDLKERFGTGKYSFTVKRMLKRLAVEEITNAGKA